MKSLALLTIICFAFFGCNYEANKMTEQDFVCDSLVIKPELCNSIVDFISDTAFAKRKDLMEYIMLNFYVKDDTSFIIISAHDLMPPLISADIAQTYEFKGAYLSYNLPILVYDRKDNNGFGLYNPNKLKKIDLDIKKKDDGLWISWLYMIDNQKIKLIRKYPNFKTH